MTISYVSSGSDSLTTGTTLRNTTSFSYGAGSHILVFVRFDGAATSVSVTDSAGNTYTPYTQIANTDHVVQAFICLNVSAATNNVVTMTLGASRGFSYVGAVVFAGALSGSAIYDSNTAPNGTSISTTVGMTLPAGSAVCVFEARFSGDTSFSFTDSAGGSYTQVAVTSANYARAAYSLKASAVSGLTVTFTGSGTTQRRTIVAIGLPFQSAASTRPIVFVAT